jgi:dTDP-4-amino-4,6-dideoxygalactose transaminase
MNKIKFNDIVPEDFLLEEHVETFRDFLKSGFYILGDKVEAFERNFGHLHNSSFVSCANGHDAIVLALILNDIGPGDKVLTTPLTAFATTQAILNVGAIPIFVDVEDDTGLLDIDKIGNLIEDVKAIIYVHLYGSMTYNIINLAKMCKKFNVTLIEDSAQCHFARLDKKFSGTIGDYGCFSFYPTKNLGIFGDAGGLLINHQQANVDKAKSLRNYGQSKKYEHEFLGLNSRCDELQAALILNRMKYWEKDFLKRATLAKYYEDNINNSLVTKLSRAPNKGAHSNHLYVIRVKDRKNFMAYMLKKNIETAIHYPITCNKQTAFLNSHPEETKHLFPVAEQFSNECVSLPLHLGLKLDSLKVICEAVNEFQN